ncbi:MAG: ATP-binding protein [Bacteroidota bacterium]
MRIKTKLTLGIGLLFVLIMLFGVVSTFYLNVLKVDTENILFANYNTLEYAHGMLEALESKDPKAIGKFELNLRKQERTITEVGEEEATNDVRMNFEQYRLSGDSTIIPIIKSDIFRIMDMNMQAIKRKSNLAQQTAQNATYWIAITGVLCFFFALILLVNLPSSIANPIKELSESIRRIAERKYSERVTFENKGEFSELAASFNTMAEKLEEYDSSSLASLMMEKKRIEALINNMNDPVIGFDENLKILFVNEGATKIIGLKQKELVGQSATYLAINNDLLRLLIQQITHVDLEDKANQLKIFANNKESYFEKEILNISIVPTGEKSPNLVGHVVILRNVTEYKELDFAKTNFIATVSHEFKTPISSMKMSLQLLKNVRVGTLNDEQLKLVESINDDANRLLKFTSELLNLTQVESGKVQISLQLADPSEIVQLAIEATKTQASQKAINLKVSIEEDAPKIIADSEKTLWVLTNLISNAIRYSYDHTIIYVSAFTQDNSFKFSVKDSGPGIDKQYKERIFDKYFRIPGTQEEGTGLGLAICKEFIEAQGGAIALESEYGSGSTFTISLKRVS